MPLTRFTLPFLALALASTHAHAETMLKDIAGHKIEVLKLAKPGTPATVVFENGSRNTLDKWDKVIPEVAKEATVFAYNRPGYGKSDKPSTPRDGKTVVEELRQLLREQGLQPPYTLVGHSLGGLYMQLYARAYPQEVQGVVLVDSLYPGIIKKPQDFPLMTRMAKYVFLNAAMEAEVDQINSTGQATLALPWNDDIPVVRLFNVPKSAGAVAVDLGTVNDDEQTRNMVKNMYPKACKVIVDSDHQMQQANPEVVVNAIRDVIGARDGKRQPALHCI
ncbi:alpha/beta hydrolase fold [Duganella sp. CF458]|uniref:alpha/beta fold hydrolase n=1 Tax=Duganella sp. CF458 TaxID=1884368 RepID=UPI0008EB3CD0|nr:alpha/beta hydrolase [Duganella sp. CF458]SFF82414.1 alpha/beta hydrolase fold [Duganella sp. CF458]